LNSDILTLKQIQADNIRWKDVNYSTISVFQSLEWLKYLEKAGVKIRIESVSLKNEEIGFIIFSERKLLMLKHLGAPLPGTGTGFGGIVFYRDYESTFSIQQIYISLIRFASNNASFVSITDLRLENLTFDISLPALIKISFKQHYFLDLHRDWAEIFKSFKEKSCRYEYRKGIRNGLSVSFEVDIKSFIAYHYHHILNVYNRKGLIPSFSINRLHYIAESLYPNNVILGTCWNEKNEPIASSMIVFNENCAFLTTAACLDTWLGKGANELLMVQCIQEVKKRGAKKMEFGGGMKYKEKYGTNVMNISTVEYSASYNLDYTTIKKLFKKIRSKPIFKSLIRRVSI
jgi:hypothetical protein